MTRALLSASLLIGVVAGCARSRTAADDSRQSGRQRGIVTAEDIERSPGISLEQLLVARIPGLTLRRAGDGHLAITIRGTSTILGEQEALYVLDGIPLQPGSSGGFRGINRHDIASIEVLSDPVSTAMYGVRGANGVIVITTKRS
jgi:TonB-dependent starch-binding outer membrane protein SusC